MPRPNPMLHVNRASLELARASLYAPPPRRDQLMLIRVQLERLAMQMATEGRDPLTIQGLELESDLPDHLVQEVRHAR